MKESKKKLCGESSSRRMFRLMGTDPGISAYTTPVFMKGSYQEVRLLWGKATWMAGGIVKPLINFLKES